MIYKLLLIFCCIYSISYSQSNMSQSTYNHLLKAEKLIENNDLKASKGLLEDLLKNNSKNNYEKSYILQTLSNIYIANNNYEEVAKIYSQIINYNSFKKESIDKIRFSLAKIYLSLEKYKKSISLSKELLNSKIKKEEIYETLILGYYYNKDYKKTIKNSEKYFTLKKQIDESWYKILYSSYIEIKDYNNAINIMKKMTILFSTNETYWVQLASLYQQINKIKSALSTLELAYKNQILTTKDNILFFINILLQNKVYKKANILLVKSVNKELIKENEEIFELIVSTHIYSKDIDLAIDKLNNSLFLNNIKYKMILANLYYQKQKYKKSIDILENIQDNKKTKLTGERYILQGLCYYELNEKEKSIKIIKKALNNPFYKQKAKNILKSIT